MPSGGADFTPETIAGIVLAAGQASRFGSDKRRASLPDGTPLLIQSTRLLEPVCRHIFVAFKPDDREHAAALLGPLEHRVQAIYAPRAGEGMGSTLADTMAALQTFEQARQCKFAGVIVMLADLPCVQAATLRRLVNAASADKIAVPCYRGANGAQQWGNPVLFGRRWFGALRQLRGARGGRQLFADDAQARILVPVEDPGILRDVDRPADLKDCTD